MAGMERNRCNGMQWLEWKGTDVMECSGWSGKEHRLWNAVAGVERNRPNGMLWLEGKGKSVMEFNS